jgi:hypothetical protein
VTPRRRRAGAGGVVALGALLAGLSRLLGGCSAPEPGSTPLSGPDRAAFPPVQAFMDHRCGSLDCHGSRYRNLRMFGHDGMRWAPGDVPGGAPTTDAEVDQTYASIVGLEPEAMAAVIADHGANPERLTLVRKARGVEPHGGGIVMLAGDQRDLCIVSWLAGSVDQAACSHALAMR